MNFTVSFINNKKYLKKLIQVLQGFQCINSSQKKDSDLDADNSTILSTISKDLDCPHDVSSLFLYAGFACYTVTCNLLLLNMIIATFA